MKSPDQEIEDLKSSLRHNRDWWAARFERMNKWAREKLLPDLQQEYFSIVANGTASAFEPPEYQRILAINQHEIDALRELVRHCWVHEGYRQSGLNQMTTAQKELFSEITGEKWE